MNPTPQLAAEENEDELVKLVEGNESIRVSPQIRLLIQSRLREIRTYTPKVGILGKTGAGKSSLCNALFGETVSEVSDIEACTREPKEFMLELTKDQRGLILMDLPGIGENSDRDKEYTSLYASLLPELDIILWVLKADDRAYSVDVLTHQQLLALDPLLSKKMIFVINQVDRLNPVKNWNDEQNSPGPLQQELIQRRSEHISKIFNTPSKFICAVSANEKYGLAGLIESIVNVVPNDKKYGFVREAMEDAVTPKAKEDAKKGMWEAVKETVSSAVSKIGDFYTSNRDTINSLVSSIFNAWLATKTKRKQ